MVSNIIVTMPRFQLNSKSLFLTYAQADNLTKEYVRDFFLGLGGRYVLVAQERHSDGGVHFHVYCEFDRPFRTVDQRALDINGKHPNIQNPRNKKHVLAYVKKDGDFIEHGDPILPRRGWGEIIGESTDEGQFFDMVRTNYPRDFVLQHERLEYFARKHFARPVVEYQPDFTDFNLPSDLEEWLNTDFKSKGK